MNLLKALATVSSFTLVSRILGFVRDAIIARVFGAGFATDAFFVAFKLPNLLRRIFAEGAFSQAFVPVLAEYRRNKTEEETRAFLADISGLLGLVLVAVTALGMLIAPWIIWASAPGFAGSPEKFALTVDLLRITFPYILFISLSSLAGSVLNTWRQFSVPAFTPTLLNVSFIACSLLLAPYFDPPVLVLAWAVFIGGIAQLAYQLPYLKKIGMLVWPRLNLKDAAVWRVIKLMGPAIFGVSIAQISLVINTIFASFLISGSVSWMYYADRLMEFPTGILGVALGTILLPSLSRHAAEKSPEEYSKLLDWGIRLSLLLALPASIGLAVMSKPLIATLFMYGKFSAHDALMTQQALIAYSIGLTGLILIKVLAPGFYARQDIKTPVKVGIFTLGMTQLMNLAFIWELRHAGLALAIGLAALINALTLLILLIRRGIYQPQTGWAGFTLKVTLASLAMAAVLLALEQWLPGNWHGHAWQRALWLSGHILLGAIAYFGLLFAMGLRPREFMRREM
ncbi:murein biosynthesis integral membrane protein MurJ [Craterilacuibacter sinensis]|uniref:Probable lipid II flippase MurJ n=1 Tax=Craterilacuibacter sinensis TaxID=2686017 RepID=A0A845BFX6_9NEIS|nr:murein biosynthesis integral membrane protein MurJ [Craterilacuibacter sinensis]MXR35647.1 murein biosynthesis integral membrane protein MurJ [Craterilacuibacter sinensis]